MKKKIICALLIFVAAIFMTGCTQEPITGADFKRIAEENGMTVKDYTSSYSYLKYISGLFIATHPDGWKVEFYEITDQTNVKNLYNTNKDKFISETEKAGSTKVESYYSFDNGERYTITGNTGYYMHVCYIDNTFVYVRAPEKNKEAVISFLKSIGY